MNDLIGDIFENQQSYDNNRVIDILQEQARLINLKSKGVIKCSFSKIKYTKKGLAIQNSSNLSKIVSYLQNDNTEELDEEISYKTDINALYEVIPYKFELYNDTYRFRVFKLDYCEFFPNILIMDSGIAEELGSYREIKIDNNKSMEEEFSKIFQTKKIKSIVIKMMSYGEDVLQKRILDLLSRGQAMNLSEIAVSLNISKEKANKILDQLCLKGKLTRITTNQSNKWLIVDSEAEKTDNKG